MTLNDGITGRRKERYEKKKITKNGRRLCVILNEQTVQVTLYSRSREKDKTSNYIEVTDVMTDRVPQTFY